MNLVTSLGWFWLSVIYGIIEMIMLLVCFVGCKEHVGEDADSGNIKVENVPLKTALPALMKNQYFFLQALLFLFLYINAVCIGAMGVYFCINVLGSMAVFTFMSMAQTIPAVIANLVNPALVKKFGKRKVMMIGSVLMIIGSCVIGLAGTSVPMIIVGIVIKGFGTGPIMSGVFAMTADVVDYGEWKTGVRSEGLVNSCTSFGMKVGIGIGSAACTWILAFGGYMEGAEAAMQPASAISAIRFGYGYFGAIMAAVCLLLVFMLNIDKNIDKIQADLQAKHNA